MQVKLELLHVAHALKFSDELEAAVLMHISTLQHLQHVTDLNAEHLNIEQARVTWLEVDARIGDQQKTTHGQLRSHKLDTATV